jgi:hypothetical protein
MDNRNLCEIARELFEYEDSRESDYQAFIAGASFMHERLTWLISEASTRDDNMVDPGFLDWIDKDLKFAQQAAAKWQTRQTRRNGQALGMAEGEPPPLPGRARNVLSDRRNDAAYELFGEGWNPDRFAHFWRMFERDIMQEGTPPSARDHMRTTFLAGISTAFYDIARIYVQAANARNPEAFRLYLRDFRRSLERVTQPADARNMH